MIVSRQRPDLLRTCLEHVKRSIPTDYPKPKVVCWDNGGDSETRDVCKEFGALRLSRKDDDGNVVNVSFAEANNLAATKFSGDVILLNNDVFIAPDSIEALLRERSKGTAEIVGTLLRYPDGTTQHFGVGFSREYWPFHLLRGAHPSDPLLAEPKVVASVTFAYVIIDRAVWDALDGLDESYFFGYEDTDFNLRAREIGAVVGVTPAATGIHLESQTEGRSSHDARNWGIFFDRWLRTGRMYPALGVWPQYLNNALKATPGLDPVAPVHGRP